MVFGGLCLSPKIFVFSLLCFFLRLGRLKTLLTSLTLSVVFGVLVCVSTSPPIFIVMRFCLAAASAGVYLTLYITREYYPDTDAIVQWFPNCAKGRKRGVRASPPKELSPALNVLLKVEIIECTSCNFEIE